MSHLVIIANNKKSLYCSLLSTHLKQRFTTTNIWNEEEFPAQQLPAAQDTVCIICYGNRHQSVVQLYQKVRKQFSSASIAITTSVAVSYYEVQDLIQGGVNCILSKDATLPELDQYLDNAHTGSFIVCNTIKEMVLENLFKPALHFSFTKSESLVLECAIQGKTIAQIASALKLSKHTVVAHRRNMMRKANLHSMNQLIIKVRELGVMC